MRWYWTKIVLGALAVFGVGYAVVLGVRMAVDTGRSVFESSDPITVPLAFLPFALDGQELGTFQRVTIRRDAPQVIAGIDLRIKVPEGTALPPLTDCRLTPADRRQLEIKSGFTCTPAGAADSALVPFGEISFRRAGQDDLAVPLLLDSAIVAELRSPRGLSEAQRRIAGNEAEAARGHARQIRSQVRVQVDSLAESVRVRVEQSVPPAPGSTQGRPPPP